ncbi:MAG: alpha/beta hydrolase [Burkholderiales bacterium]|nr:alpha/beta hydrolase [Burkholderiales bacterium]
MAAIQSSSLPPGSSEFIFVDPRPGPHREITVFSHRPQRWTPESPIVLVMHGHARNARAYREGWIGQSDAHGFLVAVPEFSATHYPTSHHYNYGDMMTPEGQHRPRELWVFGLVDRVFEELRAKSGSRRRRYFLFGHSAGGQIVHRLMTFAASPLIERALAANSGSYTLPIFDEAFPFGLGATAITEGERRELFARPITILLGDADCDLNHRQLPRDPGAMRQGPHRFARGLNYFALACREAAALDVPLAWKLRIAPGVAHSNPGIAPFAVRELLGV